MPFATFGEFFECIKNAELDFTGVWELLVAIYTAISTNATVVALWEGLMGLISVVLPYMTYILLALCVVETFFGKKLFGLQKFLLFLTVGFTAGIQYVAPLITGLLPIPEWVVGLVVGIVCALLCKFLYFVVYVVAAGYSVYMIAYSGAYLSFVTNFTKGNLIIALVCAAVAVVVALLLRKYIEMLGTAALGAWGVVTYVKAIYDFTALVPGSEALVGLIAFGVIALIGFAVQVKTRKRY